MPTSAKLLAKVGHYYFRERLTMSQIGTRLSMSRHRVGRLIREAEERGIVRIEIHTPFKAETQLEQALEDALGLKSATVVDVRDLTDAAEIKKQTCNAGAELVCDLVQPGNTIGIGWGSSTFELVNQIKPVSIPDAKVVQITGGNKWLSADFDCQEVTRRLAHALGAAPILLHAPCIVDRPETRELLMKDSSVQHTFGYFEAIDIAIVGIGSLSPTPSSTLISSDYIPRDDLEGLINSGAIGDVFSYFIDAEGSIVRTPLYDRLITISVEHLKRVPASLGVAVGSVKANAVLAAVRGGFVNMLVVDSALAEAILREAKTRGISRSGGSNDAGRAADTARPRKPR